MKKFAILYENEDFIAVEKFEGIASIPERNKNVESILTRLSNETKSKLFTVHRLDKEVSGILIFAKNALVHRILNNQFQLHQVEKKYIALIHGIPRTNIIKITLPIRAFGSGRMGVDSKRGKPSKTVFQLYNSFNNHSLLLIEPLTGRRHQIRVHAYAAGFPIAGDPRYGNPEVQKKYPRLMLHAWSISFKGRNKQNIHLKSKLPESFIHVLNRFSKNVNFYPESL
jgi:RluA family pseudouridine synthase